MRPSRLRVASCCLHNVCARATSNLRASKNLIAVARDTHAAPVSLSASRKAFVAWKVNQYVIINILRNIAVLHSKSTVFIFYIYFVFSMDSNYKKRDRLDTSFNGKPPFCGNTLILRTNTFTVNTRPDLTSHSPQ